MNSGRVGDRKREKNGMGIDSEGMNEKKRKGRRRRGRDGKVLMTGGE